MIDQRFTLSLACAGPMLTASCNGVPLIRLDDRAIVQGRGTGVLLEQNPEGFFHLLELAPQAWLSWCRFGAATVPAGARLVAHGRSTGPAPAAVQPSLALPAAPPGTRGHPRLRAPLALRLVDRDRRAVHVYAHRPAEDYTPITVRLLRKADGTAFLFHVGTGGMEQRLELRYRRGDAPALSEQGVQDAEIAVLRCRP